MLILSRKPGESIVIDGRITVKIIRLEGDMVKLGIDAPKEVPVHRQEVYDEIQNSNREALTDPQPKVPRLNTGATVFKQGKGKVESKIQTAIHTNGK
jgi:carbon storage regulator